MSRRQAKHYVLSSLSRVADVEQLMNDMNGHATHNFWSFEYGEHRDYSGQHLQCVLMERSNVYGRTQLSISFFKTFNELHYYVCERLREMCQNSSGTAVYTHEQIWHDLFALQPIIKFHLQKWEDDVTKVSAQR